MKLKTGLALGSGSARGWAHIGVIRALEEAGFKPDIICGTSIGALVGGAYAAGQLDRLENWVGGLNWKSVVGLLDLTLDGGLVKGKVVTDFFRAHFEDRDIRELPRPFAAVATHLTSGREIWLQQGSLIDAIRASMAIPGLFTPAQRDGELLVDGALVNPVPVSLCRALGADIVIAVDLNADRLGGYLSETHAAETALKTEPAGRIDAMLGRIRSRLGWLRSGPPSSDDMPSVIDVLTGSINIMQVRITRSRLAGEPADILIRPQLSHMAFMDFHRAAPAIEEGRRAAEEVLPQLAQWGLR